jgi:hypothetical protein
MVAQSLEELEGWVALAEVDGEAIEAAGRISDERFIALEDLASAIDRTIALQRLETASDNTRVRLRVLQDRMVMLLGRLVRLLA